MAETDRFSFYVVRKQSEAIWGDSYCGNIIRMTLLLVLLALGVLIWGIRYLPPEVPLYYSRPWGQTQLAVPWLLFLLPGLGLLFLLVNMIIGGMVFGFDKLLARILLNTAALTGFLTAFALVRIFWLVL